MRYSSPDMKLMKRLVVGAEIGGAKADGIGTIGDDIEEWMNRMSEPEVCTGCRGVPMRADVPPPYSRAVLRHASAAIFTTVCSASHASELRSGVPLTVSITYVSEEEWHRLMSCHEVLSQ